MDLPPRQPATSKVNSDRGLSDGDERHRAQLEDGVDG